MRKEKEALLSSRAKATSRAVREGFQYTKSIAEDRLNGLALQKLCLKFQTFLNILHEPK